MERLFGSDYSEIRENMQLLIALVQSKSSLKFDSNKIRIENSFHYSNAVHKSYKELISLSKLINNKIQEVKELSSSLKCLNYNNVPPEPSKKFSELIIDSRRNSSQLENMLKECECKEAQIRNLEGKYLKLVEEYKSKQKRLNDLNFIGLKNQKEVNNENLGAETNERKSEFERGEHRKFPQKNDIKFSRFRSAERVKLHNEISEPVLSLKSKLLLKKKLEENILKAEIELENHMSRIEKENSLIIKQISENSGIEESKNSDSGLVDKQENLILSDSGLKSCSKEKEVFFIKNTEENINKSCLSITFDELVSGMNEMRREKESLIEESKKLKEKISSIFSYDTSSK